MPLLHKSFDFQIRKVGDPESRILEFIGSTADLDRYGDVIEVEGWDFKNYLKNPVFLFAHDYKQPPVGKALSVKKTPEGLAFQVQFPTAEEYPFADTIFKLYVGGYMRATSVGFQGIEREPILGKADDQGFRAQTGWRYKKAELYELSAVPVPANPNAVMMAVQKGVITREQAQAFQLPTQAKAGAVLSAKNKALLRQAMELIGQVLAAAESVQEGKDTVEPEEKPLSIYHLLMDPDFEIPGARQAEVEAEREEPTTLYRELYQAMCQ